MRLSDSVELAEFRQFVQAFIAENAPPVQTLTGSRAPIGERDLALSRAWGAKLFAAGLLGAYWPEEWGGEGDAYDRELDAIVTEELARSDAPNVPGVFPLAAHVLLTFGSQEQKERFLPKLRSFEHIWCQLFSEPNAGSDLASLQTTATWDPDGCEWLVSGQKVWTTYSSVADYGILLARTDLAAAKHAGISVFILDMRSPGVEVRPLREITGTADFSEVFFTDVRIPSEAMVGRPGDGWAIATSTLSAERIGGAYGIACEQYVRRLVETARSLRVAGAPAVEDAGVRRSLARFYAMAKASQALAALNRAPDRARSITGPPIGKLFFSELFVEIGVLAMSLLGTGALLDEGDPEAIADGRWQDMYLYSRVYTIAAGSSEIMRNIISERGLGMPRDVRK